jgi:hypothetical protein
MQPLRRRINPQTFVITLKQLAKHLKINQERILNWEKWHNILYRRIGWLLHQLPQTRAVDCRLPHYNSLLSQFGSPQRPLVSYLARSRTVYRRSVFPTRSHLAAATRLPIISTPTDLVIKD